MMSRQYLQILRLVQERHSFWILRAAFYYFSALLSYISLKLIKLKNQQYNYKMNKTHNHILISIKNNKKIINCEGKEFFYRQELTIQEGFQFGTEFYTLYWTDCALSIKEIRDLPLFVRVNHFPEITNLTRKNKMANALNSMARYYPKEYDFYPETFLLPMDHAVLQKKQQQKDRYYIVKPENGCQGKGIYLTNCPSKLQKSNPMIIQRYITNPLLIESLKFDLRIYVLITSVQPLRIFMYRDGLARFATQPFQQPNEQNENDLFKHLTNYAINKNHEEFKVDNEDFSTGHKRLLSSLFSAQVLKIAHKNIAQIVIKSLISVLPTLQNGLTLCKRETNPNSCFQLLGFDVLITDNFKFKLLEINQNPSLMTETSIDVAIKKELLVTLFNMVQSTYHNSFGDQKNQSKIRVKDRRELETCGNFMRIYPCDSIEETQAYDHLILKSQQIYREKFGLGILREPKKQSPKQQLLNLQWNQSTQFYSKQKLAKVYGGGRTMKTSQKRRLIFY